MGDAKVFAQMSLPFSSTKKGSGKTKISYSESAFEELSHCAFNIF
jgi:hypothetical protein